MSVALEGVVVIDFTGEFYASLAGALLGDFGATVIRVEDLADARKVDHDRDGMHPSERWNSLDELAHRNKQGLRRESRRAGRPRDPGEAGRRCGRLPDGPAHRRAGREGLGLPEPVPAQAGHRARPGLRLRAGGSGSGPAGLGRAGRSPDRGDADPAGAGAASGLHRRGPDAHDGDARPRHPDRAAPPRGERGRAGRGRVALRREHVLPEPRHAGLPRDPRRSLPRAAVPPGRRQPHERPHVPQRGRPLGHVGHAGHRASTGRRSLRSWASRSTTRASTATRSAAGSIGSR